MGEMSTAYAEVLGCDLLHGVFSPLAESGLDARLIYRQPFWHGGVVNTRYGYATGTVHRLPVADRNTGWNSGR
jgi:hypothetical protein